MHITAESHLYILAPAHITQREPASLPLTAYAYAAYSTFCLERITCAIYIYAHQYRLMHTLIPSYIRTLCCDRAIHKYTPLMY